MSNIASMTAKFSNIQRPKVLFFGMQGIFSIPSLQTLLEQHIEVCAVVLPVIPVPGRDTLPIQRREQSKGGRRPLTLLSASTNPSIVEIAWQAQIPVWDVSRLSHSETLKLLAAYQPDIICVACFSQRIPLAVLNLPRLGCLNVHPSLLPANRGPVPLFWTFREGHETTGVTIHMMDQGMDTGDILAQETLAVPDGISYEHVEMQCAQRGAMLLARTVHELYEGRATRIPQHEAKSSYHTYPTHEDFIVRVDEWNARHLYNFIRGVGHWSGPLTLHTCSEVLHVQDVYSYSHINTEISETTYMQEKTKRIVQCKTGYILINNFT